MGNCYIKERPYFNKCVNKANGRKTEYDGVKF